MSAIRWARAHALGLIAALLALAFVVVTLIGTFRLYDERRARVETNTRQNAQQCEDLNGTNATLRLLLDAGLRNRPASAGPIPDGLRADYLTAYERLPETDCVTGARKTYLPPFPQTGAP